MMTISQQRDLINIDIFAYTNANFVHVEKYFWPQFKYLYLNILERIETQVNLLITLCRSQDISLGLQERRYT